MSSDVYKLDDDIQKDAFMNCVENVEIDTFTDTNIQDYFYNPFEHVDNYAVTSWRKVDTICSKIEIDGVSKDLLNNLVKVAPKIVAVCKNKIRKDPTVASPADFVNIFLNRDFYILITSPSACNAQTVCSGLSSTNNNERVKRSLWNNESYVMLRLNGDENHVPIDIESHENKRQRTENGSKKRKPTRACKFCSFTIRCEESNKFQKKNIFDKHVYKKVLNNA